MKRLFKIFSFIVLGMIAVSCYDDSAVWDSIKDHEERIADLETKCKELNTNITSLKDLVGASQSGKLITSVTPLKDGDAEIGYTITFADGKTINIYHGEDGTSGTDGEDAAAPEVGAAAEDGVLYWTLNGDWLLDAEGNKIPVAGKDGVTPQLKVADGAWHVSYDGGNTWEKVAEIVTGDAGNGMFESVTFDEKYLYITLTSGEAIVLTRCDSFDIIFSETEDVTFFPGEEIVITYQIVGGDEHAQIKAFGPEGWTVFVEEDEDPTTGKIKVTSALEFKDGDVTVLVTDGRTKTFLRTISFKSGELYYTTSTYTLDSEASVLDIKFSTNFNYWVYVDPAYDWITLPEDTKGEMRDETVTLNIAENTTSKPRTAEILIVSMNNYIIQRFYVLQYGKVYDAWYLVGDFNGWTCADENYKMTLENDMFVYRDFETEGTTLKFNIGSWEVERTGRFSSADYGALLETFGNNMEIPAGHYDVYMDKNATIVYFMTAGKTPSDALETYVLESGKYWIVAGGQWSGFSQVVAGPLDGSASYGYLPAFVPGQNSWGGLSSLMENAYTFTALEDGGYTIQDSYGRYLYLEESYNSYNVSYDLPAEAYVWDVVLYNDWGYMMITNRDTGAFMQYSTVYGTFGCYYEWTEGGYLPYLVKAEEEGPVEPEESIWGVVGTHTGWGEQVDTPMLYVDGKYVAYGVVFDLEENRFKIRANNIWDDTMNYGLQTAGYVEPDHYYSVVTGGLSGDMAVPAGTYDIWFDLNASVVYVMTPGTDPSAAQNGQGETPAPEEGAWYLVGDFNGWVTADAEYQMAVDGDWYVFYGFESSGNEVKFNGGDWSRNRGGVFVAVDEAITAIEGGANILVPAGTYDVYMDKDAMVIYFMTPGLKPGETSQPGSNVIGPEIPAEYVAYTIWEGSFDTTEWQGCQDLAWGQYDWSVRKPGQYLKFTGVPADPTASWWCLSLRVGTDWANLAGVPTQYDNPEVVVVELTQEIIDALVAGNGLVMTGTGFIVNKVELYRTEIKDEESDLLDNVVTNSSFEDGWTGWNGLWGKYVYDMGEGYTGDSSAHFTLTEECANMWDAQLFWTVDPVLQPGVTYAYEFYAKSDAALEVQFLGQNEEYSGIYKDIFTPGTDWTYCSGEFTYSETDPADILRVGIQFGKAEAAGAQLWIDNFKFGPKK